MRSGGVIDVVLVQILVGSALSPSPPIGHRPSTPPLPPQGEVGLLVHSIQPQGLGVLFITFSQPFPLDLLLSIQAVPLFFQQVRRTLMLAVVSYYTNLKN